MTGIAVLAGTLYAVTVLLARADGTDAVLSALIVIGALTTAGLAFAICDAAGVA